MASVISNASTSVARLGEIAKHREGVASRRKTFSRQAGEGRDEGFASEVELGHVVLVEDEG
jgi:hypothetical protein